MIFIILVAFLSIAYSRKIEYFVERKYSTHGRIFCIGTPEYEVYTQLDSCFLSSVNPNPTYIKYTWNVTKLYVEYYGDNNCTGEPFSSYWIKTGCNNGITEYKRASEIPKATYGYREYDLNDEKCTVKENYYSQTNINIDLGKCVRTSALQGSGKYSITDEGIKFNRYKDNSCEVKGDPDEDYTYSFDCTLTGTKNSRRKAFYNQ